MNKGENLDNNKQQLTTPTFYIPNVEVNAVHQGVVNVTAKDKHYSKQG